MNIHQLKSAIKYIQKNSPCAQCKTRYKQKNIDFIASTSNEILFDLFCPKCSLSTIVSVSNTHESEIKEQSSRTHRKISGNDVLDVKNFLTHFDGNFKKIFTKRK